MNVRKPSAFLLSSVGLILLLVGCVTFESPKVLEEGEQSFSIGTSACAAFGDGAGVWPGISAALRTHVAKDLDAGLQLSYCIYGNAIGDIKYQILTHPFYLAISLGGGVSLVGDTVNPFQPILQALLIGGIDSFYVGVRPIFNPASAAYRRCTDDPEDYGTDYLLEDFPLAGGVVVGWYGLGKKQRFILETSVGGSGRGVHLSLGTGWRLIF
jgi:hypothetical protein